MTMFSGRRERSRPAVDKTGWMGLASHLAPLDPARAELRSMGCRWWRRDTDPQWAVARPGLHSITIETHVGRRSEAVAFADPAIETLFHDADYDLRLLDREYGFRAESLFDTRIAAQLLNEPGVGLAALLEKYLGVRLDKRFQRADWSARPLSPEMLEYAASDTRHLPELRDILADKLEERGRMEWAREEFELVTLVRASDPDGAEAGWLRVKGAKALRGRELAIQRELWEWRESVARRADRATLR